MICMIPEGTPDAAHWSLHSETKLPARASSYVGCTTRSLEAMNTGTSGVLVLCWRMHLALTHAMSSSNRSFSSSSETSWLQIAATLQFRVFFIWERNISIFFLPLLKVFLTHKSQEKSRMPWPIIPNGNQVWQPSVKTGFKSRVNAYYIPFLTPLFILQEHSRAREVQREMTCCYERKARAKHSLGSEKSDGSFTFCSNGY